MGKDESRRRATQVVRVKHLYVHFPFCRGKCAYCALPSRPGVPVAERLAYVTRLAEQLTHEVAPENAAFESIYFGGGTPSWCDLAPLAHALRPYVNASTEWTLEANPLDICAKNLELWRSFGVNRLSMGFQSVADHTLSAMARGYSFERGLQAFQAVKTVFPNAGVDLIVGFPGDPLPQEADFDWTRLDRLFALEPVHCSVYSLIVEEESRLGKAVREGRQVVPSDDAVLDGLARVDEYLTTHGLERYEISNWARRGKECRYNCAVWRGEDYFGLGEGACGRLGRVRQPSGEIVSAEKDALERKLFRLRTREGLGMDGFPAKVEKLREFVAEGLLTEENSRFVLTRRGMEVCDSILAELID